MELRFVATNADVQVGDVLMTSGIDAVYPPGMKVAQVVSIDRQVESGFARILLQPAAQPDGVRHVLVLDPLAASLPTPPAPAASAPAKSPGSSRSVRAPAPGASAAQVSR
jgi:rod shape-determining protein MreC